ncbi:hypothetical protein VST63_15870 [Mycolicibacterium sp. 050232]|uniref:hypothetical protein n=1 Tax=Mycolicibacterium sp. 050232 TaxID=3113982 RepID=UPI002E2DB8D8|nr:hypothetical protein [Mycolicibacterium sp. 050232]MED5813837.1 hypothetical protein [Mycolicibacterium sp. 050232]
MTTPPGPPDDTPPDGSVPPEFGPQSFEPQWVPPAYQGDPPAAPPPPPPPPPPTQPGYPGYPYPPGYPYGPPQQPQRRISVAMVILGPFLYAALNLVIGFLAFIGAGATDSAGGSPNAALGGAAILLAFIAFGGGTLMLVSKNPTAKGLGIGLMVGWALVSLFTAGFCTGINPELYAL